MSTGDHHDAALMLSLAGLGFDLQGSGEEGLGLPYTRYEIDHDYPRALNWPTIRRNKFVTVG